MTDRTSVCNEALALLGQRLLTSFSEDQTPTAEKCRTFFDSSVQVAFEAYPWPFAKTRKALTVDADYSALAGTTAFKLPNKLGKIIAPKGDGYTREGELYLADQTAMVMIYTEHKPEGLWPAHFTKVVAAYLASELAHPVTENSTKASQMFALYKDRLQEAKGQLGEIVRTDTSEGFQAAHR